MAKLSKIRINGIDYQLDAMATLSPATTATLGGVIVDGTTLNITNDGVLSVMPYRPNPDDPSKEYTIQSVFQSIIEMDNAVENAVAWLQLKNEDRTPIDDGSSSILEDEPRTNMLKKMLYELRINAIDQIMGTGEIEKALDTITEISAALNDLGDTTNLSKLGERIHTLETKAAILNEVSEANRGKILRIGDDGNMAAVALSSLISITPETDDNDTFTAVITGEALASWAKANIDDSKTPEQEVPPEGPAPENNETQ